MRKASRRKFPQEALDRVDVESCGKSRVLIGGLARELHAQNLRALYFQMYGEMPAAPEYEEEYYYGDEPAR